MTGSARRREDGAMSRRLGKIVTSLGGAALLLAVAACSSSPDPAPTAPVAPSTGTATAAPAPESTSASPAPTGTATGEPTDPPGEAPAGPGAAPGLNRQVVFSTVESGGDRMLTVGSDGVVKLGEYSERALFAAAPAGSGFLLKTGALRAGGEAYCLQVHSPGGSNPLQLKIAGCDTSEKDQVFTFPEPPADSPGRLIEVAGLFALAGPEGDKVIVQEAGEGDFMTNFTVTDKGKANIPTLG
jgi:hypothetical protein